MNFLDVKTDFAFKKVFGSENSKEILISFLNSIVDFEDESKIEDLTIVDPYQIPLIKGMKDTYVDVKAALSNGGRAIIEMQVLNVEGFEKRVLYNAAKLYSSQLNKGESFSTLEPIIAITITDFVMFNDINKVITYFKLIEKEKLIKYNDDIELIFIELPKFNKDESVLSSITDKWIYFIKNAGKLEFIPETLQREREIIKALEIANTASMNEEELEAQHKRKDFIYLQKGSIELALKQGMKKGIEKGIEKGMEKGIEKGIEKGEKKAKIEIAKNLLGVLDVETISEKTGLSIKEIDSLKGG